MITYILILSLKQPPTISNIPANVTIKESVVASTVPADALFTLAVSDPDGDSFTCSNTPPVTGFLLQLVGAPSKHNYISMASNYS